MRRSPFFAVIFLVLAASVMADGLKPYRPSLSEVLANYKRYSDLEVEARKYIPRMALTPNWIEGSEAFWYRALKADGAKEFWLVDTVKATKALAFDHRKLAAGLSKIADDEVDPRKLPFDEIAFSDGMKQLQFNFSSKRWECDLESYEVRSIGPATTGSAVGPPRRGGQGGGNQGPARSSTSPDGKWTAEVRDGRLKVLDANKTVVYESRLESVAAARWSPDSKRLIAFKLIPGERRELFLVRSSSRDSRGQLLTRLYDQPGDRLDTFKTFVIDPFMKSEVKTELPPIWTGGQPWASAPGIEWMLSGEFQIDYAERGYGRYFVDAISAETGKRRSIVDEDPTTFFDTTAMILRNLRKTPELIWRSERDGWGRLLLIDANTGTVKNFITPEKLVVRSIEWIDEDARRLCFSANGMDREPYYIHYYTVGFDGNGLTRLTNAFGTHRVSFSPNRKAYLDTWSRVDQTPQHSVGKTSDGAKIIELDGPDLSDLKALKLPTPESFVAKGRDGKTDIWGVVYRPSHFDPSLSYPILENHYAGPHDSFAPKTFSAISSMQRMAELGFVVVQLDGMGTRNRGKAFHDLCYKNIVDAGFPDREIWIKELSKKYPYMDATRVGIYGTSAGGQTSTAALLHHGDFYKAAVSSCGCHDNRIDKFWWNEQWMGAIGPHYAEQSNITNAAKLQGNLMLIVGELDTNVPPESTFRLADALIKAKKEFELVVIPGADHTSGGSYGDRKRIDFFIRNLLGVQTPSWNTIPEPGSSSDILIE